MKYFQKQSHICLKTKKISFRKQSHIFSEAATQKKICSEAAAQIFTVAAQNTLRDDFQNLLMVMKTPLMDGFKTLFRNLTALYEYYWPRHNACRNKQISRACFARMSQCLDHRP